MALVPFDVVALVELDAINDSAEGPTLGPGHALAVGGIKVDLALRTGLRQATLNAGVLVAEVHQVATRRQVVASLVRTGRHTGRVARARFVALHRAELLTSPLGDECIASI